MSCNCKDGNCFCCRNEIKSVEVNHEQEIQLVAALMADIGALAANRFFVLKQDDAEYLVIASYVELYPIVDAFLNGEEEVSVYFADYGSVTFTSPAVFESSLEDITGDLERVMQLIKYNYELEVSSAKT